MLQKLNETGDYLNDREVALALGLKIKSYHHKTVKEIADLFDSVNVDYHYSEEGFLFNRFLIRLLVSKQQFELFMEAHIKQNELCEKYGTNPTQIKRVIERNGIPKYYLNKRTSFLRKEDAEKYFSEQYEENTHLHMYEAMQVLGLEKNQLGVIESIENDQKLNTIVIKKRKYFYKEEIDNLLIKIDEVKSEYCGVSELKNILSVKNLPLDVFTPFPVDGLSRHALGLKSSSTIMYSLQEIYAYKKEREDREKTSEALEDKEPVDAFNEILKINELSFGENSKYTEEQWYNYCKIKLKLSNSTKKTMKTLITNLIQCSKYLADMTENKELYAFTSNEINLKLFNKLIPVSHQCHLYSFMLEFHNNVILVLSELKLKKRMFDVKRIINPYLYEREETKKETYEYQEYVDVYDYAKNMFHKKKAIKDAENIIASKQGISHYTSSWIYVLTHLGNAWRHGDVMNLPVIDVKEDMPTLDELKKRDLTSEEANYIVNQIKRKDFIVNKTNATTRFNCPDDLVLPFATALLISSYVAKLRTGLVLDSDSNHKNNKAINFGIVNDDVFPQRTQTAFFEDFKLTDFKFQSRKMNRTVLVLMYMILVNKGKGSAALELSKRLRAHENFETTNIYLLIPDEELDQLCESLFDRKPFGYIVDMMATVLLGDNEDRSERTEEIIALHQTFGGVLQIEATTGYINAVNAERKKVSERIFEMGVDEVSNLMFDLQTNSLPSHEENYQCITYPDCKKPELLSCKDCPFAVPNFYAISSLVEGIKATIMEFIREFDVESFDGEKTRLMNLLYKDMDHLERAMQKFGQKEVFDFFENGEEEYNQLLTLLDEVQNKTGEDFEKYLTYSPIHLN